MIDTKKIAESALDAFAANNDPSAGIKALCDAHAANAAEKIDEAASLTKGPVTHKVAKNEKGKWCVYAVHDGKVDKRPIGSFDSKKAASMSANMLAGWRGRVE